MYSLEKDPARHLLRVKIAGFWRDEELAPFARELNQAIAELNAPPGQHVILADVSESAIQAQPVVEAFQRLVAGGPTRARRIAIFTDNLLARRQARRVAAVREDMMIFDTAEEAERWLFQPAA